MSDSVGYTDDGMVFMRLQHFTAQGEPLETTIMWKPGVAKEMGTFLIDAAEAALAQNDKEGSNNDSSTDNKRST